MEAVDQHKMAAIQRIVEALNSLETQHAEMRAVEKEMADVTENKRERELADHLERLRQQRVRRPRICINTA